jgi:hypothetical protein
MKPIARISARPIFDPLRVDPDVGPARTEDGEPWVRWTKQGRYSGWFAVGSRLPRLSGKPTFWEAVYAVASACAGGNVDQVHCCGPGLLSLGGLGVTLRSGYAQLLLHRCLLADPARYVEVMMPVLREHGVFTKPWPASPSGVALFTSIPTEGHRGILREMALREIALGHSDGIQWTGAQKKTARTWVACCSRLLRDQRMDPAQIAFAEEIMPPLLTWTTATAIRWPSSGLRGMLGADGYTREQQCIWALALVMSLQDEDQTEQLMCRVTRPEGGSLVDMAVALDRVLGELLEEDDQEMSGSRYEPEFQERCRLALRELTKLMQVA